MNRKALDQTVARLEHHLECWKQFNDYVGLARTKKFTHEDETQFLEIKCVLTQELELILCSIDCGPISREDVHALISSGPSIRFLSEMNENALRNVENNWHKLFIGLQSLLGQLKVKQGQTESKGWFGGRKAA